MPNPRPALVHTVAQLRDTVADARRQGQSVGLVPTMGALHEGHLSLVRASRAECDYTVVSIFVNPTQFSPEEDLDQYPRTLDADLDALATCEAQLVFAPATDDVYGPNHTTGVNVGAVAEPLEGQFRPNHFGGVATVVLKLLNMVQPDVAYFGQKDYQQYLVIRRMVEDLDAPVTVRAVPTVREPDGLALSSRNMYLSADARRHALVLWQSLALAQRLVAEGQRDAKAIAQAMRERILSAPGATIDYVALVDPETLAPAERLDAPTLAAVAVRIERTRLIDNCLLEPK